MSDLSVHFSSKTDDWATPQDLFDRLNAEYQFTLDPCADGQNHKCARYFTKETDGLKQDWSGERVFMNPPYGNAEFPCKPKCKKKRCPERGYHISEYVPGIEDWMRKAYESSLAGALVVCLLPARTDTEWWHEYAVKGEAEFLKGRLKFGNAKTGAPFPSAIVVFTPAMEMKEAA